MRPSGPRTASSSSTEASSSPTAHRPSSSVPNQWAADGTKLTHKWETEAWLETVSYVKKLWALGVYHPDTPEPVEVVESTRGEYRASCAPSPANVAALTAWLAERELPLEDLRAGRQRLDDVFRRLTAHAETSPGDPDEVSGAHQRRRLRPDRRRSTRR